jgi:hypothetical protein
VQPTRLTSFAPFDLSAEMTDRAAPSEAWDVPDALGKVLPQPANANVSTRPQAHASVFALRCPLGAFKY